MFFNPTYWLFALPALLLGLWAQWRVRSAYTKFSKVANRSGLTGYEAARRLLEYQGLSHVQINETKGQLSDHYDPRSDALYLSSGVARTASVASLSIVAHEIGHAMQDHESYLPLRLRSGVVPVVQLGSWLGPIVFFAGYLLAIEPLAVVGLVLFSGTLLFALVTLPVELDASNRAMVMLTNTHLVSPTEEQGARTVLRAAAMTYVAALVQAISTILYYVFLLTGGRRRR